MTTILHPETGDAMPTSTTATTTPPPEHGWGDGPVDGMLDLPGACRSCGGVGPVPRADDDAVAVTSPDRAAEVLGPRLAGRDREACVTALLDTRHRVLAVELVSLGSIDHTFMAPREIYRLALGHNAAALVVAHNHPSGDPTPSGDDVAVTTRLVRAGDLIGVQLLDHLVVAGHRWRSLARAGHV